MPVYRSRALPVLLICLLLANGCATMHHGHSQPVIVKSEPAGARILVGGEPAGVTPDFVMLSRRGAVVTLEKDGFRPAEIDVPHSMAGVLLGNVALGVLWMMTGLPMLFGLSRTAPYVLGATVGSDLATGAAWELRDEVGATLEPASVEVESASARPEGSGGPPSEGSAVDGGRPSPCRFAC